MEPARPSQDFFGEYGTELVLAQPGSGEETAGIAQAGMNTSMMACATG